MTTEMMTTEVVGREATRTTRWPTRFLLAALLAVPAAPLAAFGESIGDRGAEAQSERAAGDSDPQTTMDYDNTNAMPERFTGEVVCMRSDERLSRAEAGECEEDGRVLALAVQESDAIQPIVAADDKMRELLVERIGERVVVEGKRYEATGSVMASTVLSAEEAN